GERYRKKLATCAHRTHPFGTILVVTAVDSGKTATCRVNDRGPWKQTRVLDVSRAVAKTLGMLGPGVLTVRVEVQAAPTSEPPTEATSTPQPPAPTSASTTPDS
ncbi:MAG TPA: septal ring lytic transglycosylase RlpA family protein, partial [Myxococcota bacterium]